MRTKYSNQNISDDMIQGSFSTCLMAVYNSITNEAAIEAKKIMEMAEKAKLPGFFDPQENKGGRWWR